MKIWLLLLACVACTSIQPITYEGDGGTLQIDQGKYNTYVHQKQNEFLALEKARLYCVDRGFTGYKLSEAQTVGVYKKTRFACSK